MYNRKAMIDIINSANLYLKGILKKGDMLMKIYKKLFAYVQDKKYLGVLAIIFSAISAALTVYGYYLIYKFLDKLIINSNLSGAESIALKSVITLTSGAIFYFVSGMFSHILGFRLETNLRKRGIDGLEKQVLGSLT